MTAEPDATQPDPAVLRDDPRAWDAFVESAPTGAYTQLGAWAEAKRPNGWRVERVVASGSDGPVGMQLLIRDLRPLPWRIGYAPRGPVGSFGRDGVAALTAELRRVGRANRLAHVLVDPEVEPTDPLVGHLAAAGWKDSPGVQTPRTRLVDLTRPEEELWSDLRSKWRRSFFGVLWSIIQPLGLTILIAVVFGRIFKTDIVKYAPYILSGVIIWDYISSTAVGKTRSGSPSNLARWSG